MEVKNNCAHVTTQRILNKFIELNFSVGCMVWPWCCLFQDWTTNKNIDEIEQFTNLGWLTLNSMKQLLGRARVTLGLAKPNKIYSPAAPFDNAHLDESSCVIIKNIRNNLVSQWYYLQIFKFVAWSRRYILAARYARPFSLSLFLCS